MKEIQAEGLVKKPVKKAVKYRRRLLKTNMFLGIPEKSGNLSKEMANSIRSNTSQGAS